MHSASLKEHTQYLGEGKKLPLRPPTEPTREDTIFETLRRDVPKPRAQEARKNEWISAATWRLVDERVSARRDIAKDQTLIWRLGRAIRVGLTKDRRRRAEEAGAEVEVLLGTDPPLHLESWYRIKGWYKAVFDHAPPAARFTLERVTAERVELYSYVPPPGKNIPIPIQPFLVVESVSTEDEIKWAVKRIRNHRSGGPSGMRAEQLKRWLATERKAEKDKETAEKEKAVTTTEGARTDISAAQKETESDNWTRVVDLVQSAFQEGKLAG